MATATAKTRVTPKKKNAPTKRGKRKPQALSDWEERFLDALQEWPNVTLAAKKTGVSRWEVYRTRQEKPDFLRRFNEARVIGVESLEDVAIDMTPTNPTMMIFMLKNLKPDVYADRHVFETWQDRVIALLRDGKVTVEQVASEFGADVATDLAIAAGISIGAGVEVGETSGENAQAINQAALDGDR